MQLTVMPWTAHSQARARVRFRIAPLAAWYDCDERRN
jgi:hypothetical protein